MHTHTDWTESNPFLFQLGLLDYYYYFFSFLLNCNCCRTPFIVQGGEVWLIGNIFSLPYVKKERACKHIAIQLKWKKKEKWQWILILFIETDYCACALFKQLVTKLRSELHASADTFHKHIFFIIFYSVFSVIIIIIRGYYRCLVISDPSRYFSFDLNLINGLHHNDCNLVLLLTLFWCKVGVEELIP